MGGWAHFLKGLKNILLLIDWILDAKLLELPNICIFAVCWRNWLKGYCLRKNKSKCIHAGSLEKEGRVGDPPVREGCELSGGRHGETHEGSITRESQLCQTARGSQVERSVSPHTV